MASDDRERAEKLWALIKDIRVAMMTTIDSDVLRSRPMESHQNEFDGELWFFTRAGSHKSLEIGRDRRVNLSYANPDDQQYVSVSGIAELVRDPARAKAMWDDGLTRWFPKGVDDADLALLRVKVEQAEYWDEPSAAMVTAYGYVKALTGETPDISENEKLRFEGAPS